MVQRLLLIAGITVANFVAWIVVYSFAFGRVMGSGGSATKTESLLLAILGFPLVNRRGEDVGIVARNSLTWGLALGFALPAAWHAYRRTRVAA